MDTGILGHPYPVDRILGLKPRSVDTPGRFKCYDVSSHCDIRKDRVHLKQTHTNNFTAEQREYLRHNQYVASVTASTVRFTDEFKKLFYRRLHAGEPANSIFLDCGIDPEVLGHSRVKNFQFVLNKNAKRDEGFADNRKYNYRRPAKTGDETVETRIKQLEHELAYTRQEVEFLKKLQMADMEARRQWESRHQPQ